MTSAPSVAIRMPEAVRALLWDVNLDTFDPKAHPEQVLERVLELGSPEDYRWALGLYGPGRIRDFIRADGARRLTPRALNYWAWVLDVGDRECLVTSCLRNRSPLWIA